MLDYNNTPLSECDGFTPLQMHTIIYYPFEKDCPIKINILSKELLIKESPILKIVIELLKILKSDKTKLTTKGNLPPKIIKYIYDKKYLSDRWIENGIVKLRTETDWIVIHNVKLVLILAGLIKKKHNYLSPTKKCETLLKNENYSEIFYEFLKTFTLKFNWAYNDRYDDEKLGQIGFLYSLYLLNKYGSKGRDLKYYIDLYFLAFPSFIEYKKENESMKEAAFHTRFIERFASWFGFVEEEIIEGKKLLEREIKIKSANLLEQLLQV